MNIAILTAILTEDDFKSYHYRFKELAGNMGHKLDLLKNGEFTIAYGNGKLHIKVKNEDFFPSDYDVMMNRMSVRASDNSNYYIIDAFDFMGVPYFNNVYSVMRAKNKFHTLSALHYTGIPIPKTVVTRRMEQISDALYYIGQPPYIIKEIYGSGGSGVLIAESKRAVYPIFDFLWRKDRNAVFTIQELIIAKTNDHRDVRAIVLDNKVITAMERIPKTEEFRANLHQGGLAYYTELTEEEKIFSIKAAKTMKLDFAGVDFIRTEKGPFFLEVNSTPGIEGVHSVSEPQGIDLVKEILDYCIKIGNSRK